MFVLPIPAPLNVAKTSLVPAEKLTGKLLLLDCSTASRDRVVDDKSVPRPTSHSEVVWPTMAYMIESPTLKAVEKL